MPAPNQRTTIANLPLDPVEGPSRQVFFFDTPELVLNDAGVVVRARRIQGSRADTVIKLRPVVPAELPAALRHDSAFNVEVDVLPGGYVCSGSLKGRSTGQEVRDAVPAPSRCARSSPGTSVRSTGTTPRPGSTLTRSPCWARRSSSRRCSSPRS